MIWFGTNPSTPVKSFSYAIDSAINYLHDENPSTNYRWNRLFVDSGAYTAAKKKIKLERDRILEIQEKLNPTLAVPLDFPYKNSMSYHEMVKSWQKTQENMLYWQETSRLKIVATLHAWSPKSLEANMEWIMRKINTNFIAIGSIVSSENIVGFFGDRQPSARLGLNLYNVAYMLHEKDTSLHIHLFGFASSPLTYHIGRYLGYESMDSAGYRRKAAYGKILLPGTGERYLGNGKAMFGIKMLTRYELRQLAECGCPVCRGRSIEERIGILRSSWVARMIHNKWVLEQEEKIANRFIREGDIESYEQYIDSLVEKSGSLRSMWKVVKRISHHKKILVR